MTNGQLVPVETQSNEPFIKRASIDHELGHQFDFLRGVVFDDTGAGTFGAALDVDYATLDSQPCTSVLPAAACSAPGATNSQKLENWLGGRRELFAHIFARVEAPATNYAAIESALSNLPTAIGWMRDEIALVTPAP